MVLESFQPNPMLANKGKCGATNQDNQDDFIQGKGQPWNPKGTNKWNLKEYMQCGQHKYDFQAGSITDKGSFLSGLSSEFPPLLHYLIPIEPYDYRNTKKSYT